MIKKVNKYINDLLSNETESRRTAVERLGEIHTEECIEPLLTALGDKDWRVRKTVVSALLNFEPNDKIFIGLISSLRSGDNAGLRNAAVEVLTKLGALSVPFLIDAFKDNDRDVRKFIADILGDINDKRAANALVKGLSDPDENVCLASVEALGKLRDESAIEPLLKMLKTGEDNLLLYTVIKALEKIGNPRIVDVLITMVNKHGIEKAVVDALGAIGDIKALNVLISAFKDKRLRNSALVSLIGLYEKNNDEGLKNKVILKVKEALDEEIITYLIEALESINPKVRSSAIRMFGWSMNLRAVKPLLKLLDSDYKNEIINAIINIGRDAEDMVIEEITKGNEVVREAIARILGEIGNKKSVNHLILLLGDENGHVRQTSAIALGKIGDAVASKALIDLLNDEYPNVQEAAVDALSRIKDKSLISHFIKMLSNENENIRGNGARILGKINAKEAVGNLLFMLKDESPYVRQCAVNALGSIHDPAVEGGLMIALTDEEKQVRYAAVSALVGKKNKKFLNPLISLLKDNDIWIRVSVVKGIAEIGGKDAVQPIIDMLDDKVGVVRIAAIDALGRIGDKKMTGRIVGLINDKDWDVKLAAIKALGQLKAEDAKSALEDLMRLERDTMLRQYASDALGKIEK
ncbi:MAG: HEAT repeat domain-containing protein [Nitrospirae bacterium]|nr:HEAT repeat domain-containing protein [Nitrospirota bacterium]